MHNAIHILLYYYLRYNNGEDGLLSVHTQEYPRLSSSIGSDKLQLSEKSVSLPMQMNPGKWYYIHRDVQHVSPAFACKITWKFIWEAVECMQKAVNEKKTCNLFTNEHSNLLKVEEVIYFRVIYLFSM